MNEVKQYKAIWNQTNLNSSQSHYLSFWTSTPASFLVIEIIISLDCTMKILSEVDLLVLLHISCFFEN